MRLTILGRDVVLDRVLESDYQDIKRKLASLLALDRPIRDAIRETFLYAVTRCPEANPSDVWHHLIYREFLELRKGSDPKQSWVRASGEAFEQFLGDYYNPLLQPYGIRFRTLFSSGAKAAALRTLGVTGIGGAKLDIAVEKVESGAWRPLGVVHAKASLAERVSDDVPASERLMKAGFFSPLATLDVKSFPPPHGDLVNRGELGSPATPTDKRRYIEEHGSFSHCYSYNLRTVPSVPPTSSGKLVYTLRLNGRPDQLVRDVVAHDS